MRQFLEKYIYVTEKRFDLDNYRKPIIWFDKMLIIVGLSATVIGQIFSFIWCLKFVLSDFANYQPIQLIIGGVLLWICGSYFVKTGNRGLIYYHMDFLTEYFEKKVLQNLTPETRHLKPSLKNDFSSENSKDQK